MANFTKVGQTFFRQDPSGQMFAVTDRDTLNGLKNGQLPYSAVENTRGLSFAGTGQQSSANSASAVEPNTAANGLDIKSTLSALLQKSLKNYQGVSNVAELEERKQALLKQSMLSSPGKYAPGGDVASLGAAGATSALENVGSEFNPAIRELEIQVNQARQGDELALQNLTKLLSLGKDAGLFGEEQRETSLTEVNGQRVLVDTQTGEVIKTLGSASSGGSAGLSPYQLITTRNQIEDNMKGNLAVKSYGELVNFGVPDVIAQFEAGIADSVADTILMRTLAKVTDPATGVREEEYRTFENAIGALNQIYITPKSWIGRGRLTDTGRAAMIREIQNRYNSRQKDYITQYNYYNGQAADLDLSIPPPYEAVASKKADTSKNKEEVFNEVIGDSTYKNSSWIVNLWNDLF